MATSVEQIRQHYLIEEAQARQLLKDGIFPLGEQSLHFIFGSLAKQIAHTEQILQLAPDQAEHEREKLHSSFVTLRRVVKEKLIVDLAKEIHIRLTEEKEAHAGVKGYSVMDVKGIRERCDALITLLGEELACFDAIELAMKNKDLPVLDKGWHHFLGLCYKEATIIKELRKLFEHDNSSRYQKVA